MKWLIFFFSFVATTVMAKPDCNRHQIYCRIVKLRPDVNRSWAMKLSNHIFREAKKYPKIDPMLVLSIAMQESGIKNINRKQKVLVKKEICDDLGYCEQSYEIVEGYTDMGLFQFHVNTITAYGIEPEKLEKDIAYAVKWHFKLLDKKIKRCAHLKRDAWSCYHSTTPRYRNDYLDKVKRYYNKPFIQKEKVNGKR